LICYVPVFFFFWLILYNDANVVLWSRMDKSIKKNKNHNHILGY
jgi:hypothetical protein